MIRPLALALILSSSLAFGATPTIDQLLSMKSVARPRISPDGRLVAYEISETDWKENAYVTHIWLADVQSGRAFQLTRGKKSSDNVQWSPDGRWLAFMTEREVPSDSKTPRQIWLIPPAGGEAWQLTKHGASIDSFRWSDDSRLIAFTAPVAETQAAKDRKEKYSDFEVFEEDFEQNQLWTVDVAAAEKSASPAEGKQITSDARVSVGDFDWSPDGKAIAFSGGANPLIAFDGTNDLYLVDLARENAVKKITALPGPESDPRFSPDGRELAFNTSLAADTFYYVNTRIATVRLADVLQKPATEVANVTAGFDEDATIVDWAPAGIYFRGLEKTASHLYRLDPKSKATTRITAPDEFYFVDGSFSRNFDTMAYTAPGRANVTEVYVGPLGGTPKKLTDMMAQYAGLTLGSAEVVSWKSKDGATIEGVLRKPANYDASKKYPLLVVIHGGPTGVSRPIPNPTNRYYPLELFLAKGALVLEPNYRGSAGYGEQFRTLNVRNLGVGDMWDVMSGIDALVARGIADPDRLGSMGWSQGGYISAFLTTNTDRFKAISVGAGISNWMTYYVNTDITPFTRQYLKATPWDDPKIYADTSPMTNIRNAKTPTLIQHGQNDKRVPAPNAYELYRGLRDVGVPTRLIVYAGFGHAINKPKSNRAALQHNYDWFTHYIWGEPFPKDSPLFGRGEDRSAKMQESPAAAIDHLIIGVSDLASGVAAFEKATGVSPMAGGKHPSGGTENALVSLGNGSYLEIIAPRSDAQASDGFASYLRTLKAPALIGWAVRVQDVAAARAHIQQQGLVVTQPTSGSRITPAGQKLEWVTFSIEKPAINTAPFFIQWSATTVHPSTSSPSGCTVRSFRLEDPESEILSSLLRALNIEVAVQEREKPHMHLDLQCAGRDVSFASQ